MILQRILKDKIVLRGIGVHSGNSARIVLRPAPADFGIVFARTDLDGHPRISARFENVVSTQLATTLGYNKVTLSTVEHVLAALQGLEVDNALVEVDGPEVPIMDGSSAVFCEAIEAVGTEQQLVPRPYLALRKKVELKMGEKWAVAEPASRLEVFGSIDWDHPSIGYQEYHYVEGQTPFQELAAARTFGFLHEVEALRKMGLARGGSLENAVVLDHALVLNPDGLRYPDEFVRHKVLDALGDFKLAGIALQGYVRLHRAGHELHHQLLVEIFKDPDNYEIIENQNKQKSRMISIQTMLTPGYVAGI